MPSDPGVSAPAAPLGRLALIVARAGSKGLPGKNLALLGSRTLLGHAVATARQAASVDRVVLSTDCARLAEQGKVDGAEVPFLRPAELATDTASPVDVALHLLRQLERAEGYRPEWLLLLQPTSPLRTAGDLDRALDAALSASAPAVLSVTVPSHHPMLAQTLDDQGRLSPLFPDVSGRRQDLPPLYQPNGAVYWIRPEVLTATRTFYPPGTLGYVMPPERSIDIDTPYDLALARAMLELSNPPSPDR